MSDIKGKILLLYSGGLDTSCILKWFLEEGYEVQCFMADVGQKEDFEAAKAKALKIGASKVHVEDLRRDFVENYIYPAIACNAIYENRYLLGTSLARPCIAKKAIEVAEREGCNILSHGATGKGNDQVRFELCFYALSPEIEVRAPWREKVFTDRFEGRAALLDYAKASGIPVEATKAHSYSIDANLMHISYESGVLEDPAAAPPASVWAWIVDAVDAPDQPEFINVTFKDGIPVKVENTTTKEVKTDSLELFCYLNDLGAKHGIGRIDIVENRFVGIKSRGLYETPGGTILFAAHVDIEGIAMDREVRRVRDFLVPKFSELVYNGFWFSPEMEFILGAFKKSQEVIDGVVNLRLYKGGINVLGRQSSSSLYDQDLSSMDIEGGYNQGDAEGFIKINAIRLRAHQAIMKASKTE